MNDETLDHVDKSILRALQRDGSLSQRELADQVGLSQNSCWRRLTRLKQIGVIQGQTIRIDPQALGLGLTVFVMLRTRNHSAEWVNAFRRGVLKIENVIDFYRIAGNYDYMLKIAARDMNDLDRIYQRIIRDFELDTVTSYITMETIADGRDLPA